MKDDITTVDPVEQCFEHFGILGMKWGRRRSTKELQAARGKKDWEEDDSSEKLSADERQYRELSKKSISEMSTEDIRSWVNRQNAINDYNRLKNAQPTGQNFIDSVLTGSGKVVLSAGKEVAKEQLKKYIKKGVLSAGSLAVDAIRNKRS